MKAIYSYPKVISRFHLGLDFNLLAITSIKHENFAFSKQIWSKTVILAPERAFSLSENIAAREKA
jgi:hypothetical protein